MSDRLRFPDFVDQFIRVENPMTGRIGPMVLYDKQREFVSAVFDARDTAGLRPYRRGVFSVPKKLGKTTLEAASGLKMLMFDEFEKSREVYSIAHDLDQARLAFTAAVKMIRRSPRLTQLVRRGRLKMFKDVIEYEWGDESGIFRCLASDSRGLHGISPSCLLVDETWTMQDYDLLEACSLPPTRRCPLELHFTYAGLKAQQNEGVPLWDLFRVGMAGTDPKLFFLYEHGRQASFIAPWMTATYLEERERALPRNRFTRLHYNEWGASDTSFLTDAEIARALDGSVSQVHLDKRHSWVAAVDYGRTFDHTAVCVARRADDGTVIVGELVVMKGSREHPVPLELVEETLLDLKRRFNLTHVHADAWQMHGSIERLRGKMRIEPVSVGPAYLNRITLNFLSLMRSGRFKCFHHPELEAQLGSVICRETFYGIRIDSGAGAGVKGHDDIVMACSMAASLAIEKGGRQLLVATVQAPGARRQQQSLAMQSLRRRKQAAVTDQHQHAS